MLKIIVFESNWYDFQIIEFDNVFDALKCARTLRAEYVKDRRVEIYCDSAPVWNTSNNLSRTDLAVPGSTYTTLYERMLEEQYAYACRAKGIKPITC